jgi:DNA polymerase family B
VRCYAVTRKQALLRLIQACRLADSQARAQGTSAVAAAHFLRFDLTVMVVDYLGPQWRRYFDREHFSLKVGDAIIEGHVGHPAFATIRFPHQSVTLLDTASYFPMSLNRAAQAVGIKEQKMGKPEGLGYRVIPLKEISPYLKRDVFLCHKVAEQIVSWWDEWKIRPAISAPHFASRVFRHVFVKRAWVDVPPSVERQALLAYHGGKNGFYTKPGWYKKVYSYDLRSAYCWAMTQIPDMTKGEWIWVKKLPRRNRYFGFCVLSGETPAQQKYPVFFTPDFQAIGPGEKFSCLTVTATEYACMRRLYPQAKLEVISAVLWKPDISSPSDLASYARTMYARRLKARKEGKRTEEELFKLLANSLYGKFIARVEEEDGFRKGEIFYAPVAAWITALVRCRITSYEHSAQAIHTSTDGFLALRPVPKRLLGMGLGSLKLVNVGPLVVVRNKCYLHFREDGSLDHAALHGFQGTARDLWKMIQKGTTTYVKERLSGLLESYRGAGLPFAPMTRKMRLRIPEGMAAVREKGGNPFKIRARL